MPESAPAPSDPFEDHPFDELHALAGLPPVTSTPDYFGDTRPSDIVAEVRRILTDDHRARLQRSEVEVAAMNQAQREATADWLGAMLHRPPLERPSAAWRPIRALVEALWWDIADRTPADPEDPDAGNERLVPNHPWGEGSEA